MTVPAPRNRERSRRGARRRAAAIAALAVAAAATLSGCDRVNDLAARAGLVSFESVCAKQLPPTRVEVTTEPISYDVDTTRSYRELTGMSPEAGSYDRALGLTLAKVGYRSSTEMKGIEQQRDGRACVRPTIRIAFSMTPMTVFVGSEYHGDACREAVIMAHERKHVAVYSQFIVEFAREMRDAVSRDFGNTIFYAPDRAQAQRDIEARLATHLEPAIDDSMRRIKERQKTVDSPEEYARVAAACGGMAID